MIQTIVHVANASYGRGAYLVLEDNKVIFDDSEGEYGPIKFNLEDLKIAINNHQIKINNVKED